MFGFRYNAWTPIRRISVETCRRPTSVALSSHSRSRIILPVSKWMFKVQLIDAAHQAEINVTHRMRAVVETTAADAHRFCLSGDRQLMSPIDHRFAPGKPAFASAPSKKSFPSASSPILACSVFMSTGFSVAPVPAPNASAARSSSWVFYCVIWFGCTSNWLASSASVRSSRIAASATFALKSAEWLRRGRLLISRSCLTRHYHASLRQRFHLSRCSVFRNHLFNKC